MNNNNTIVPKKPFLLRLVVLVVLMSVTDGALGQSNNEVSLYLQGSYSKLDYEALQQKSGLENGYSFGARYAYYFSENWSIGTGAELQYIESSIYLPMTKGAYQTRDQEGEDFEFRYRAGDFSENQYTYFLNIPLQIQYETSGRTRFYAAAGIKAGLVLESEYEAQLFSLVTSGYYPQYDVELTSPEFAGFGEFGAIDSPRSEFDVNTNFILNVESGVKFLLENKEFLYLGGFLDYGLNNIHSASGERLIGYNNQTPRAFSTGSLLASSENTNSGSFVEELRTFAFGFKIQYAFQF